MRIVRAALLTGVLVAGPCAAFADDHPARSSAPPCGWKGGSLPDPGDTQRCLADRYKAPKPKTPDSPPRGQPTSNPAG